MLDEGLPVHEAVTEAELQLGAYALVAYHWDNVAFEAGNDAALNGAVPF